MSVLHDWIIKFYFYQSVKDKLSFYSRLWINRIKENRKKSEVEIACNPRQEISLNIYVMFFFHFDSFDFYENLPNGISSMNELWIQNGNENIRTRRRNKFQILSLHSAHSRRFFFSWLLLLSHQYDSMRNRLIEFNCRFSMWITNIRNTKISLEPQNKRISRFFFDNSNTTRIINSLRNESKTTRNTHDTQISWTIICQH